jgi:tetratricopeptide (TPR) repeat protein
VVNARHRGNLGRYECAVEQSETGSARGAAEPLPRPRSAMPLRAAAGRPVRILTVANVTLPALLALLLAVTTVPEAAGDTSLEPREGLSPDALLAHGVADSKGADVRLGLEELRAALAARPHDALTRTELAVALLRAGLFEEAEGEFAELLGRERADELARGKLPYERLGSDVDPPTVLGLATAIQMQGGRPRQAERLYRAYAEMVGPLSPDAARAYMRLHELAEEQSADWLDADAELAKAEAVNPKLDALRLLPQLIDPTTYPELEPYLRPVELAPSSADSTVEIDELPMLALWVAPGDSTPASAAVVSGLLQLRIAVDSDGVPASAEPVPVPTDKELGPLRDTVLQWRFSPAISGGEHVAATILFGDVSRDEWSVAGEPAADAEAAAGGESAAASETAAGGEGVERPGDAAKKDEGD